MAMELDQVFIIDESAEEALGTAHQKMDAARASGDERARALCLIKAGDALTVMGRPDEAWGYIGEGMHLCTEMKYEEGRAAAMNALAKVHVLKGSDEEELEEVHVLKGSDEEELEEALDSAADALKLFRKLGYKKGEAAALTTLSGVYVKSKKAAQAVTAAKEALAAFAELGEKRAMAGVYDAVKSGYLAKTPPEPFLAAKQMEKAAALYQEIGDKSKEASCMHSAATIEKDAGDAKKAAAGLQKAKDLFAEAGDARGQCMVLETMMTMLLDAGLYYDAVKVGKQRVSTFRDAGDSGEEARAMIKLGDVMMKNDDPEKAEKIAVAAIGLFAGINEMEGMKMAKDLENGAKHAKAVQEIETSVGKASDCMHVPKTLLVDPGLNKRVTSAFGTAITA